MPVALHDVVGEPSQEPAAFIVRGLKVDPVLASRPPTLRERGEANALSHMPVDLLHQVALLVLPMEQNHPMQVSRTVGSDGPRTRPGTLNREVGLHVQDVLDRPVSAGDVPEDNLPDASDPFPEGLAGFGCRFDMLLMQIDGQETRLPRTL